MEYQTKKCLFCGADFKPATANARYCSDKCRKAIAKQNSVKQARQNKLKKQITNNTPLPETPTPLEVPALPETPPEVPTPDTVPPTETTTPLNSKRVTEDIGESEKKSFRKFFYD